MEIVSEKINTKKFKITVFFSGLAMTFFTSSFLHDEKPSSPCATLPIQATYCSGSDFYNPKLNKTIEIAKITGINDRILLIEYLIITINSFHKKKADRVIAIRFLIILNFYNSKSELFFPRQIAYDFRP